MKKIILSLSLLFSMYSMHAFLLSRPMFFLMGALTGAGTVPYFVKVQQIDTEFKATQERIDYGNKQTKEIYGLIKNHCTDSVREFFKTLLPKETSAKTRDNEQKKEDSK